MVNTIKIHLPMRMQISTSGLGTIIRSVDLSTPVFVGAGGRVSHFQPAGPQAGDRRQPSHRAPGQRQWKHR